MGLGSFRSNSHAKEDCCCKKVVPPVVLPNPNPKNFSIKKIFTHNSYVLVWINYPDCTNYEGDKILLLDKRIYQQRVSKGSLDPHFFKESGLIARMVPTQHGWRLGKRLLLTLS